MDMQGNENDLMKCDDYGALPHRIWRNPPRDDGFFEEFSDGFQLMTLKLFRSDDVHSHAELETDGGFGALSRAGRFAGEWIAWRALPSFLLLPGLVDPGCRAEALIAADRDEEQAKLEYPRIRRGDDEPAFRPERRIA